MKRTLISDFMLENSYPKSVSMYEDIKCLHEIVFVCGLNDILYKTIIVIHKLFRLIVCFFFFLCILLAAVIYIKHNHQNVSERANIESGR